MYVVTRKNHLARNLMKMKRAFPEEYNFFPQTWLLPGDNTDLRNTFQNNLQASKKQTFIIKPDAMAQGKGIFLSRNLEQILEEVQRG